MLKWFRKPMTAKARPDFGKTITAEDVFTHLLAKIDAADAARNPSPEPEQPGVTPRLRR